MQADEDHQGSSPRKLVKTDLSELDQLKQHSLVVADTGDFSLIEKYQPEDSTTNPTLILQVAKRPDFKDILETSITFGLAHFRLYCALPQRSKKKVEPKAVEWATLSTEERLELIQLIYDHLCVSFGVRILQKIKGYVSTQVDAKFSFDKNETVRRAKRIIAMYEQAGIGSQRILIKIASTWQGIKAGQILKKSKINCNMTLVFHKIQALACADCNLFLISPFVGRILDWHKKENSRDYTPKEDPGVLSVTDIYNHFKKFNIKTIVMGASFRSTGEIKQLCGCDRLTISPKLLDQLQQDRQPVEVRLTAEKARAMDIQPITVSQQVFRYEMNKSKMATDLLSQGIRSFEKDGQELKDIIAARIQELQGNQQEQKAEA